MNEGSQMNPEEIPFDHPNVDDRVHVIEIPDWLPESLNHFIGKPWQVIDKAKKETAGFLAFYAYKARAKMVDHQYRPVRDVRVLIDWHTHEPDPDNVNKVLRDALKRARLVVDDSPKWAIFHEPSVKKGDANRTRIILRDLRLMPAIPVEDDPEFKRFLARHKARNGKRD